MVSFKIVIIALSVIAAVVIASIVLLILKNPLSGPGTSETMAVSAVELSKGLSVVLKEKEEVRFNFSNEEHTLTVNATTNNSVNITIQSTIITTKLTVGQTRRFDLNNDDDEDVLVRLNNITDGKADLYLKEVCFENWTCTDWAACSNNNQTRECTDANSCNTDENKPVEIQGCLLNCSQLSGFLCDQTEICNGTINNASEGNCCLGSCVFVEPEFISCGIDMDCLISAAENCNPANVTYPSNFTNSTWTQTTTYYYKIRGFEDEKCKLYREVTGISGAYTSSKRQSLSSEGKTDEEINQLENAIESEFLGKAGICRFSVYALAEKLTEVKSGSPLITGDEIETYGCTGDILLN